MACPCGIRLASCVSAALQGARSSLGMRCGWQGAVDMCQTLHRPCTPADHNAIILMSLAGRTRNTEEQCTRRRRSSAGAAPSTRQLCD